MSDLRTFLQDLGEALAPIFDEQRAVWEREGPAACARAAALRIVFDEIGGNCPVQSEGSFDQQRFYFRARYNNWRFHAWSGSERNLDSENSDEWVVERSYGTDMFDAGWMHRHEAIHFICDSVEEYRAQIMATLTSLDPETEKRLDQLALSTGRTKAYYLREMIERSIDDIENHYLAEKIMEDVRAGREELSSIDDVERRLGLAIRKIAPDV